VVFGNLAHELTFLPAIREACRRADVELDVISAAAGTATAHPESILGGYDLAFAKAKCAMEAMACGLAVIVCGETGVGGLVRSANFDRMRRLNFGIRTLQKPLAAETFLAELALYDAADARAVSDRIRRSASSAGLHASLLSTYQAAIEEHAGAALLTRWKRASRRSLSPRPGRPRSPPGRHVVYARESLAARPADPGRRPGRYPGTALADSTALKLKRLCRFAAARNLIAARHFTYSLGSHSSRKWLGAYSCLIAIAALIAHDYIVKTNRQASWYETRSLRIRNHLKTGARIFRGSLVNSQFGGHRSEAGEAGTIDCNATCCSVICCGRLDLAYGNRFTAIASSNSRRSFPHLHICVG